MGYEFHIKRQDGPDGNSNISLEEWLEYVERDPEFRRIDAVRTTNPASGALIKIPGEGMAVWKVLGEDVAVFDYRSGRISVPGVQETIPKAKAVAAQLGARVFGDDGEEY